MATKKVFVGVSTSSLKLYTFRNQSMKGLKREQILQLVDVIGYSDKPPGCILYFMKKLSFQDLMNYLNVPLLKDT